jgi:hypothetical protein
MCAVPGGKSRRSTGGVSFPEPCSVRYDMVRPLHGYRQPLLCIVMQCLLALGGNVELRVPRRSVSSKAWLVRSEEMEKQVRSPAAAGKSLEPRDAALLYRAHMCRCLSASGSHPPHKCRAMA